MSVINTVEYDAFGPWVSEVRSRDDIPRLFRDHDFDLATARLVLKIPRQIERRNATPSMDLYDLLLIAEADSLVVLTRHGAVYESSRLDYDGIAIIEDSVSLLDGRLSILTRESGAFVIPYNGSSRSLIGRLVDLLREVSRDTAREPARYAVAVMRGPLGRDELGSEDVSLTTEYRDLLSRESDIEYFGGYGRRRLLPSGGSVSRVLHRIRPAVLHAVVACGTARELHLLSRRDWLVRSRVPVFSSARTIIRVARLDSATARPHPDYFDADIVTVRAGSAVLDLVVVPGSTVERAILAAGNRVG